MPNKINNQKKIENYIKKIFLGLLGIFVLLIATNLSLISKINKKAPKASIIINSIEDFEKIRTNLDGNFELGKDISFPDPPPLGSNWIPIDNFSGTFDGKYHKLSNITINAEKAAQYNGIESGIGIFGSLHKGRVQNLVVENMNVTVQGNYAITGIGCVVGRTNWEGGTIYRCTVTCNITYGSDTSTGNYSGIGGICGAIEGPGSVKECAVRGNILLGQGEKEGQSQAVGMIVGFCTYPDSTISDCYSSGHVQGTTNLGGLIGLETESQMKNCYSTVTVEYLGHGPNRGGIIGWSNKFPNPVDSCYYDYEVNTNWSMVPDPNNPKAPLVPENIGKGIPKSDEELKIKDTFKNWDFEEIWIIDPKINDGMPWLRWIDYDFAYGGETKENDYLGDAYWTYDSSFSRECFCIFPDFKVSPKDIPVELKIEYKIFDSSGYDKITLPDPSTTNLKYTVTENTNTLQHIKLDNPTTTSASDFDNFISRIKFSCATVQIVNIELIEGKNILGNRLLISNIENPMRLNDIENDIEKINNFSSTTYEYEISGKETLKEIIITPIAAVPDEVEILVNNYNVNSNENKTFDLDPGNELTIFYITLILRNKRDCIKTYELKLFRPNIINVSVPTDMFFQVGTNYQIAKFISPIYRIYNNSNYATIKIKIDSLNVIENDENAIILVENQDELNKNNINLKFNMLLSSWVDTQGNQFSNINSFNFTTNLSDKELGCLKPRYQNGLLVAPFYGDYKLSMPDRTGNSFEPGKQWKTKFNLRFIIEKV